MEAPLVLGHDDVVRLLDPERAVASQRVAFLAQSAGTVDQPGKIMHSRPDGAGAVFAYLAHLSAGTGYVAKVGSVNPGNAALGLPSVSATVIVMDPVTGRLTAVLDGTALTTLRTAAASAVAVDALAAPDADTLAVLGSGVQARAHVRALARVRPIRRVLMWSPSTVRCRAAATGLRAELGLDVAVVERPDDACADAAVVVAATLSRQPVVRGATLRPGCTVVSIGSFEPDRCEVDQDVIARSRIVVVDDPTTALAHAGPIMAAVAAGRLAPEHLVPLGALLAGRPTGGGSTGGGSTGGRTREPATEEPGAHELDIAYFNSVGVAVQDAAAAWAVVELARQEAAR